MTVKGTNILGSNQFFSHTSEVGAGANKEYGLKMVGFTIPSPRSLKVS
jgi:hypothetical protein